MGYQPNELFTLTFCTYHYHLILNLWYILVLLTVVYDPLNSESFGILYLYFARVQDEDRSPAWTETEDLPKLMRDKRGSLSQLWLQDDEDYCLSSFFFNWMC